MPELCLLVSHYAGSTPALRPAKRNQTQTRSYNLLRVVLRWRRGAASRIVAVEEVAHG